LFVGRYFEGKQYGSFQDSNVSDVSHQLSAHKKTELC